MTHELIAFLHGRIPIDELPERIELSRSLWRQLDTLWQRSVAEIKRGRVIRQWHIMVVRLRYMWLSDVSVGSCVSECG